MSAIAHDLASAPRWPRRIPPALAAGSALLLLILIAPWLAPYSPVAGSMDILLPPDPAHWFGTDQFGRDIFSRFLAGGRSVTEMSIAAGLIAVVCGGAVGLIAGYRGGWLDAVLMRCVDVQLAMPPKLLVLVFAMALPRSAALLVLLVGLLMMPGAARVIRGIVQGIAAQDFVAAAEVAGTRFVGVTMHEILPNIKLRLVLEMALRTGFAVLILAGLNFLGIGLSPPSPDWGLAINEGRATFTIAPLICLAPASGIVALVASVSLITNGLATLWK